MLNVASAEFRTDKALAVPFAVGGGTVAVVVEVVV